MPSLRSPSSKYPSVRHAWHRGRRCKTPKRACQRALELDPALAEAHTSLAFAIWRLDFNWVGAEQEFNARWP